MKMVAFAAAFCAVTALGASLDAERGTSHSMAVSASYDAATRFVPDRQGFDMKAGRALFNGKDLTGWYTYLQNRGRNIDPKGVFSVTNGVISITGEEFGALVSDEEFSNYHLMLEYRFLGGKQHGWKATYAPDSGILFHSTGPDGRFGGIWMESLEVNLIKGATGDFWGVGANGSDAIALSAKVGKELLEGKYRIFDPTSEEVYTIKGNTRVCRFDISRDWRDRIDVPIAVNEKPIGEWNRVDLYCVGDEVLVSVNGKHVNHGFGAKPTKGRLQLQSEGCAIEFRNVYITPQTILPATIFALPTVQ